MKVLEKLLHLSQIKANKDIKSPSYAMFPGAHCPLFGVMMHLSMVDDLFIIVLGTDECAYYGKNVTLKYFPGNAYERTVNAVLDANDVTFGSTEAFKKLFTRVMEEYNPKAVMVITTCLVEIIGDDYDAVAEELEQKYGVPVMVTHTDHFKYEDHISGMSRTLLALLPVLKSSLPKGEKVNDTGVAAGVNILGLHFLKLADTELYQVLQEAGIATNVFVPGSKLEEMGRCGDASMNIVVDASALALAKALEKKFGTPYVELQSLADPEKVYLAYKRLFRVLNKQLPQWVEDKYREIKVLELEASTELVGTTYANGLTAFESYELNAYLCGLGLKPVLLQGQVKDEMDWENIGKILECCDPYVTKGANLAPLEEAFQELKPKLYMGMADPRRLAKWGVRLVNMPGVRRGGFEATKALLTGLKAAVGSEASNFKGVGTELRKDSVNSLSEGGGK